MDNGVLLIIITFFIVAVILIAIVLHMIQKSKVNKIQQQIDDLDKRKNIILSTPVPSELSKVEAIIKNEKMEERYKNWQKRFEFLKNNKISNITDMLAELDVVLASHDYKGINVRFAKTEIEIYKAQEAADELLSEIREITLSEEKYRDIVIRLKTKYRDLFSKYSTKKEEYGDISDAIELQFENIEKRFSDFEEVMENNEYTEVVHIVKALDTMIDHMEIVIKEVPDLVLLAEKLIPKRIEEIEVTSLEMIEEGYNLEYLKIDYNIEESRKNIKNILGRIRVLNLEECMFELKTILEYMDSLFNDFDKEKICRKFYNESIVDFEKKLNKLKKIVGGIYTQLDDIKSLYDLTDDDLENIYAVTRRLDKINTSYLNSKKACEDRSEAYSRLSKEIEDLSNDLRLLEDDLDVSLKSLGSMYDDEVRAREQLGEIQDVLDECKFEIRSYKLPIINNNYFVQLSEASEAIEEIIKELEKKPIVIKVLNTRVDTARDLVLKLHHTTSEMVNTAKMVEDIIVYGNRYRGTNRDFDRGFIEAEDLFFKGKYKDSLGVAISSMGMVDAAYSKKLWKVYREK
ncbi:MAG: hypothetical protein HFG48_00655, partial [Bacilli bacterium]|nr:hypothetical protein [Bacilli bacterium]